MEYYESAKLSTEQLRNIEGLENTNDSEAETMIDTIYKFSLIIFDLYKIDHQ